MKQDDSLLQQMLGAEDVMRRSNDFVVLMKLQSDSKNNNNSVFSSPREGWRLKIVQWFYDVVDCLDEPRSVVYVAMNILDRYSTVEFEQQQIVEGFGSVIDNNNQQHQYRIAALTALFLAIRVSGRHSNSRLLMNEFVRKTIHGNFSVQDVVSMGNKMLNSLSWKTRLATPHDFVDAFLREEQQIPEIIKESLRESTLFLAELTVYDPNFVRISASRIAMTALINTIEKSTGATVLAYSDQLRRFRDVLLSSYNQVGGTTNWTNDERNFIQHKLNTLLDRAENLDDNNNNVYQENTFEFHYVTDDECEDCI